MADSPENCNHQCEGCSLAGNCSKQIEKAKMTEGSSAKHVIGVVSGKGGVGKPTITSLLACELAKQGYSVGILDADITGPSIPYTFNIKTKAYGNEKNQIFPALSKHLGIKIISSNMLLDNDTDPVIWRGPLVGDMVIQFFSQVVWGDLDYLLIDMPPGTGDVPLSIFQQIKVDGIVIATTPQSLVSMVVSKACNMAKLMNIPILGLICNMAYLTCPKCGEKIYLYGDVDLEEMKKEFNIPLTCMLPFDRELPSYIDSGQIENFHTEYLSDFINGMKL